VRDLPAEVDNDFASSFFSEYGEVLPVEHDYFDDFPTIRNGNRLVKILLAQEIPCFVRVENCGCRVWYPGQPSQCSICNESVLSLACHGAAVSPAIWPENARASMGHVFLFIVLLLIVILINHLPARLL